MFLQDELTLNSVHVQQLNDTGDIQLSVLRLDLIHSVVSGNKWFKLKYYLKHAIENKFETVATFGGAFSNHILATAYACHVHKLKCIGFIRGERPVHFSETLKNAQSLNMQFEFLGRAAYNDKQSIMQHNGSIFFIPEGGYGITGAKGAAEIMQCIPHLSIYDYLVCAVGTGTMLAGIANAGLSHQQCIGISVMKNNHSLEKQVLNLVNKEAHERVRVFHDHHFGGYAKHTPQLINFMNDIWMKHQLPLDFVYTAKALHAIFHLATNNYFPFGANVLFIHSGGLQGNHSLQKGRLLYGQ